MFQHKATARRHTPTQFGRQVTEFLKQRIKTVGLGDRAQLLGQQGHLTYLLWTTIFGDLWTWCVQWSRVHKRNDQPSIVMSVSFISRRKKGTSFGTLTSLTQELVITSYNFIIIYKWMWVRFNKINEMYNSYNYSINNLNSQNGHIFQTIDFRTYNYWTFSTLNEPQKTSLSYG
jgi:hypothetical protein